MTRILYMEGDPCAPKYLGGALAKTGFEIEQVLESRLDRDVTGFDVFVLSDYPARNLDEARMREIARAVERGDAGLLMVGGWNSFGRGGYANTPLADALPVRVQDGDDRVNVPTGLYIDKHALDHPVTQELPFENAPVITGYNRLTPKPEAEVVLDAYPVLGARPGENLLLGDPVPLLITGEHGRGRVMAIATDLAPHWSGGLSDWGGGQTVLPAPEGEELGLGYVRLVAQMIAWTANAPVPEAVRNLTAPAAGRGR